jgi:hypothetical protein
MKAKKAKKLIIALIILLVVSFTFCTIDTIRASNAKKPLFCLPLVRFKDGGTVHYYGLGYSIYKKVNYEEYWENKNTKDGFDWSAKYFYFIPVELYDCQNN